MKTLFSITLSCVLLTSCLKDNNINHYISPPEIFYLDIRDSSSGTDTSVITNDYFNKDSFRIYYPNGTKNTNVNFWVQDLNCAGEYHKLLLFNSLPYIAAEEKKETFFLYFNTNDIDTLKVKIVKKQEGNFTWYNYEDLFYNDIRVIYDKNCVGLFVAYKKI